METCKNVRVQCRFSRKKFRIQIASIFYDILVMCNKFNYYEISKVDRSVIQVSHNLAIAARGENVG